MYTLSICAFDQEGYTFGMSASTGGEPSPRLSITGVADVMLSSHASANMLIIVLIILAALALAGVGLFATEHIATMTMHIAPHAEASQVASPVSISSY